MFLVLFAFPVSLINFLCSPAIFKIIDEIQTFQYISLIEETGKIAQPNIVFEVARYYPGLSILTVIINNIADPTNKIMFDKIVSVLIHVSIVPIMYCLFKKLASVNIAAVASFLYIVHPLFTLFDSRLSYQTLGVILFILAFYCLFKSNWQWSFSLLAITTLLALVVTHHWSSYMFIIIIFCLVLVNLFLIKKISYINFLILSLVFVLAWIIYNAAITIKYFEGHFIKAFTEITKLLIRETPPKELMKVPLPFYEIIVSKYLYIPTLLSLFLAGIYTYWKRRNYDIFTSGLALFSLIFWATLPLTLTSDSGRFATRTWSFTYFGLALVCSYGIQIMNKTLKNISIKGHRIKLNKISAISILLLLMMGGIIIGQNPWTRVPTNPNMPSFSTGPTAITESSLKAAGWTEFNAGRFNNFIGDLTVKFTIGAYGFQNVEVYGKPGEIFLGNSLSDEQLRIIKGFDYIGVNYLLTRVPIFEGDVKDSRLSKIIGANKLPESYLKKFDHVNFLYNIYDNGRLGIYKII